MGAIDRVAHILPGSDDGGRGQEKGHGEVVVQPEDDIVRLAVAKFDQVLDSSEDTEHLDDQSLTFDLARVIAALSPQLVSDYRRTSRALDCQSHSRSLQLPRDTTSVTISCSSHFNYNAAAAATAARRRRSLSPFLFPLFECPNEATDNRAPPPPSLPSLPSPSSVGRDSDGCFVHFERKKVKLLFPSLV